MEIPFKIILLIKCNLLINCYFLDSLKCNYLLIIELKGFSESF